MRKENLCNCGEQELVNCECIAIIKHFENNPSDGWAKTYANASKRRLGLNEQSSSVGNSAQRDAAKRGG